MKIFIRCNTNTPEYGSRLRERLLSLGIECDDREDRTDYDMVCAIGGDGTILDAADFAVRQDLPVFGINTGRVGFLAAFDKEIVDTITAEDILGLYESRRVTLSCSLNEEDVSINEIGIFKKNVAKTVELEVLCEENTLGTYRCDGILVSTPTGSTAYNLSAGGPVLYPEVSCVVITPICAYNSSRRSMVLPADRPITVRLSRRAEEAVLVADGRELGTMEPGESVRIHAYERPLRLLLSHGRQTYELLSGTHDN